MLNAPLPGTLDVRKAASRGVTVQGYLNLQDVPRFRDLLAGDEGAVEASLGLSRDEEGRFLLHVVTDATVSVTCQRCLRPMPLSIHGDSTLAVVWTDEQARHLPSHLEPLVQGEEECDLRELVTEELILALPPFSYHEREDCNTLLAEYAAPTEPEKEAGDGAEKRPNPFDILAQLKRGDTHQE